MKFIIYILILPAIAIACNKKTTDPLPPKKPKLHVLGYLYSANYWDVYIDSIDLTKITDLNLAFVNPDTAGNFQDNDGLRQVVEKAHTHNVRIFFSIGGGDPPSYLGRLLENDKRPAFVSAIVQLADKYNFDGVDADLENDLINSYYASFINELSSALKPKKKLLTAALATWNSDLINNATLQQFDFINIMSYDKTGPWDLSNPGPHSPFSMAQDDFNYFNKTRNIAAGKLLIGLPFYGYGFGNNAPAGITYKDITASYPGSENTDMVEVTGGGKIYYNGIPTIKQKVSFAMVNKAAGVMIWELRQDSNDSKSLLLAINATINQ